jgi:hypothetical protein
MPQRSINMLNRPKTEEWCFQPLRTAVTHHRLYLVAASAAAATVLPGINRPAVKIIDYICSRGLQCNAYTQLLRACSCSAVAWHRRTSAPQQML